MVCVVGLVDTVVVGCGKLVLGVTADCCVPDAQQSSVGVRVEAVGPLAVGGRESGEGSAVAFDRGAVAPNRLLSS